MKIKLTKRLILIAEQKHAVQSQITWVAKNTGWQVQPFGITVGLWWVGVMWGQARNGIHLCAGGE